MSVAPALSIESRRGVTIETAAGAISATTAIVTVPTNVIAAGAFKFSPDRRDLFARLPLGSYDRIALELVGNPLGLESDDLVFEKSSNNHTAAILGNVGGTPLCFVDVSGSFGRDLSAQGETAMFDFAAEWLSGLYGGEIKRAIGRKQATRWNAAPYALGAWSGALPGAQSVRRLLMDRLADDVWYAGEAAHETLWGTVGGAWESGERAADAVLRRLGGTARQPAPAGETESRPKPNRNRHGRSVARRGTKVPAPTKARPASCATSGKAIPLPPIAVRRTASLRSPMRSAWWGGVRGGGTLFVSRPPPRLISLTRNSPTLPTAARGEGKRSRHENAN